MIIICTFLLTFITLIENMGRMLEKRKDEISNFKILGWKLGSIRALYIKEISLWTGLALLIGSTISFVFFFSFYPVSVKSILFIIVTALCLYGLIIIVSYSILRGKLKQSLT